MDELVLILYTMVRTISFLLLGLVFLFTFYTNLSYQDQSVGGQIFFLFGGIAFMASGIKIIVNARKNSKPNHQFEN